jgi:hypothetical protein
MFYLNYTEKIEDDFLKLTKNEWEVVQSRHYDDSPFSNGEVFFSVVVKNIKSNKFYNCMYNLNKDKSNFIWNFPILMFPIKPIICTDNSVVYELCNEGENYEIFT